MTMRRRTFTLPTSGGDAIAAFILSWRPPSTPGGLRSGAHPWATWPEYLTAWEQVRDALMASEDVRLLTGSAPYAERMFRRWVAAGLPGVEGDFLSARAGEEILSPHGRREKLRRG